MPSTGGPIQPFHAIAWVLDQVAVGLQQIFLDVEQCSDRLVLRDHGFEATGELGRLVQESQPLQDLARIPVALRLDGAESI